MSKAHIVLSPPRCGSSALAKSLHDKGIFMGEDFISPDTANPLGYYEDMTFVKLTRSLMDWSHPKDFDVLPQKQALKLDELIHDRKDKEWGVKVPALVFMALPLHRAVIKAGMTPVYHRTERNTIDAATSLRTKILTDWNQADCEDLILKYKVRIWKFFLEIKNETSD